jgi:rod shape determining protein RodA
MFLYFLKKLDWSLMVSVLALCIIGLLSIYPTVYGDEANIFYKQLAFVVGGFFLMFVFAFLDYRIFKNHPFFLLILYFLSVLFLVGVLIFGREVRGATSWFRFGILSFEPVELAKLVVILILAEYYSLRHIELYRIRHVVISGIYMLIPVALVFFQPDFGSAMVLLFLWLGIMIISGIKLRQLLALFLIGAILFGIAWFVILKPYQKERITAFINPYLDPLGSGYHRIQSVIAVGSGGFWGRGLGHGSQSQLKFLPDRYTDFIFASVAEELGFVGLIFVFVFYFLLFARIIKISIAATNNFARLFCVGTAIVFIFHIIVNIGMNLGLLPIAGISLPFISSGGSNLLIGFVAIGIIQSIGVRNK